MMNNPKRGRGEGHVTYFWSNGTDNRVPQNVFLVIIIISSSSSSSSSSSIVVLT